jgi:GTPase SAR1 family protein
MATATGGNLGGVGASSGGAKAGRTIRKYRICILGPSFVGKTQIINRFINNSFSPYYESTLKAMYYRKAFNILEDQDVEP